MKKFLLFLFVLVPTISYGIMALTINSTYTPNQEYKEVKPLDYYIYNSYEPLLIDRMKETHTLTHSTTVYGLSADLFIPWSKEISLNLGATFTRIERMEKDSMTFNKRRVISSVSYNEYGDSNSIWTSTQDVYSFRTSVTYFFGK